MIRSAKRICRLRTSRFPFGVRYSSSLIDFKLADIGEGIYEVEIIQWFVKEGQHVNEFDKICEVQSDKANVEITSRYAGNVHKLMYGVGDLARVGLPLLQIETGEANPEESADEAEESDPAPTTTTTAPSSVPEQRSMHVGSKPLLTPAVRRLCKENNLDPSSIRGTGKEGRILKEDVLRFLEDPSSSAAPASSKPSAPKLATPPPSATRARKTPPPAPSTQDTVVPIKGVMRIMVQKMNEANQVPQFGYGDEIDVTELVKLRTMLKKEAQELGLKLSYMPFLLKATSLALNDYPILNATVDDKECSSMTYRSNHNISIAVDTPNGLIVPNIKQVQTKSLLDLAQDLEDLTDRARNNKITNTDLTGGTFSLSNIGAIGGTYCRPIVFVPEVCIGALGGFRAVPQFADDGSVVRREMMAVSWSADHRVIDGATMARFSNKWKSYLENPAGMVLHLR